MTSRPNPFVRGPKSFSTGEELFGRDIETAEITDLLIAERIVLLYSQSGAGKSSLIHAALIPRLQSRGFLVRPVMRVGLDPSPGDSGAHGNKYVASCLSSLEPSQQAEAGTSFAGYLGAASDDELLIFDQFEEIITVDPVNQAAKEEFFAQVGAALRDGHRWALFAMREEYVAQLDPYRRLVPTRLKNTYRLDLLGVQPALDAMRRPAKNAGVPFDPDAAERLTDDLRRVQVQMPDGSVAVQLGPYVEPVQLQVVCRRLWEKLADDAASITGSDIAGLGDVDQALAGYYQSSCAEVAARSGVSERAIRDWFQNHLITAAGIRGQVLKGREQSDGLPNSAIALLVDSYLVRSEERNRAIWFELTHDRLIDPVRSDNARWRADLHPVQRRAELWGQQNRPASLLLADDELAPAELWASREATVTEVERDFLAASIARQQALAKERRQRRFIHVLAVVSIVVGLVAAAAALLAYRQMLKTIEQTRLAESRELAASALRAAQSNPALAISSALGAMGRANTQEARQALQYVMQVGGEKFTGHLGPVNSIAASPDGQSIASASDDGTVLLWTTAAMEHQTVATFADKRVWRVEFSPSGDRLVSATADGMLHSIDPRDRSKTQSYNVEGAITAIAFHPSGGFVACAVDGKKVVFWGFETGGTTPKPLAMDGKVNAMVFLDPDHLLTGRATGDLDVWDLKTGERRQLPVDQPSPVQAVVFTPRAYRIAAAFDEGALRLWKGTGYQPAATIRGFPGKSSLAFSTDGKLLAQASAADGNIVIRDVDSQSEVAQLLALEKELVTTLVFLTPDVLLAGTDPWIRRYDLNMERLRGRARARLTKLLETSGR